jgi:hypothetical protein
VTLGEMPAPPTRLPVRPPSPKPLYTVAPAPGPSSSDPSIALEPYWLAMLPPSLIGRMLQLLHTLDSTTIVPGAAPANRAVVAQPPMPPMRIAPRASRSMIAWCKAASPSPSKFAFGSSSTTRNESQRASATRCRCPPTSHTAFANSHVMAGWKLQNLSCAPGRMATTSGRIRESFPGALQL